MLRDNGPLIGCRLGVHPAPAWQIVTRGAPWFAVVSTRQAVASANSDEFTHSGGAEPTRGECLWGS